MWDSAKKPIKVRSVLQRNGMRHFVVNEESDEVYSNFLQQKQRQTNSKPARPPVDGTDNAGFQRHHHDKYCSNNNNEDDSKDKMSPLNVQPLHRSQTLNEVDERRPSSEIDGDFFGVAGSKICNSKTHKGQCTHYFHQFHNQPHNFAQLHKESMDMSRCPRLRPDLLDLVPVKSPVIKKLISGGLTTANNRDLISSGDFLKSKLGSRSSQQDGLPPNTLCSRIMTWIDLEVKRNTGKGKPLRKLSFTSADLSLVNDLALPPCELTSTSPSSDSGSESTSSGEGINTSSSHSSSCNSSSEISLPKLVPCWRKEKDGTGNKVKKSVRISDDLPRWGNMKRRGRLKDRSLSLHEMHDDGASISSQFHHKTDRNGGPQKLKGSNGNRKCHSTLDLTKTDVFDQRKNSSWNVQNWDEEGDKKETDNFLVCDEKLTGTSGKLQVHIFLPQTE